MKGWGEQPGLFNWTINNRECVLCPITDVGSKRERGGGQRQRGRQREGQRKRAIERDRERETGRQRKRERRG